MEDHVSLAQLSAELGLTRSATRDCLRKHGIKPRKLFLNGRDARGTHVLTLEDAERLRGLYRTASEDPCDPVGQFFVVQLVPDLEPRRIRLGFTHDVTAGFELLRTGAPTAVVTKTWPCKPTWTVAVKDCVTASGCHAIVNDVFDCDDVPACVARGETFFALLPHPAQDTPSSVRSLRSFTITGRHSQIR